MKIKIIVFFAILCLLTGCNDTDVLDEIEQEQQTRMLVEMQKAVQEVQSKDKDEVVETTESAKNDRQQLGTYSLSLASQAAQSVLRLF